METNRLRTLTADAAETVKRARLWPNGIGFSCGRADYMFCEHLGAWLYSAVTRSGVGDTPASARANARPISEEA
jgi:hypothetical protein